MKKQLTQKQRDNLAAGRAKHLAKAAEKKQAETTSVETSAPIKKERKQINIKQILTIIACLIGLSIGIYTGLQWTQNPRQPILGILTFLLLAIFGLGLLSATKKQETKKKAIRYGQTQVQGPVNSINIYARQDPEKQNHLIPWKVDFAYEVNPPGMYRKLRNDGKYYYLNVHDTTALKDCVLPDNQYCDPRRFLIPVEMEHTREYYKDDPTLFQRIKPFLWIVMVIIGGIILAMVSPAPGG